jgi:hypothetical protein
MGKIKRGWALSKKSWGLLNEHRELLRFPLYGAVATIPLAFVFVGPGLYLLDDGTLAGAIPLLVIGLYVLSVVGTFFGVALYRYALDGQALGGFTPAELESAVKAKGGRNAPPTATPGTV